MSEPKGPDDLEKRERTDPAKTLWLVPLGIAASLLPFVARKIGGRGKGSEANQSGSHRSEKQKFGRGYCIQGWSGVAKWTGVRMEHILEIVKPKPNAKFVVFYALSDGEAGGKYYDVHEMKNMHHSLTILAYGMNNHPLKVLHGAPLRLRVENELGFKMVKWLKSIEFVEDFHGIGAGQGGYHEDHEFYGYRMPI